MYWYKQINHKITSVVKETSAWRHYYWSLLSDSEVKYEVKSRSERISVDKRNAIKSPSHKCKEIRIMVQKLHAGSTWVLPRHFSILYKNCILPKQESPLSARS